MKLYRFSPIKSEVKLFEAIEYTAKQAAKLYFREVGQLHDELISSLTIFTHYEDEYVFLKQLTQGIGKPFNENNGPRIALHKTIKIMLGTVEEDGKSIEYATTITHLRIRKPDPYRMQVGCVDLNIDFNDPHFEGSIVWPDENKSPRVIKRETYDMLELFNPSIDVLAYIVSKPKNDTWSDMIVA